MFLMCIIRNRRLLGDAISMPQLSIDLCVVIRGTCVFFGACVDYWRRGNPAIAQTDECTICSVHLPRTVLYCSLDLYTYVWLVVMASLVWRGFTPFSTFVRMSIALCILIAYNTILPDRRRHPLHQSSKAILVSITHFVMEDDTQSSLSAAAAAVAPPRRSGRERRQAESVYDDATAAAAAAKRKKSRMAEASEEAR